jgi:hypothetical protein
MPCSQDHFIPILDELDQRIKEAEARAALRKRRGGTRPGSGPPEGNLNALKHGRFSRRHKIILETILEVLQAREALLDITKRNRRRQTQAELEAAYILMRWLATHNPQFLPAALDQAAANLDDESDSPLSRPAGEGPGVRAQHDQTHNDQLETALADMKEAFNKKLLRKTTKNAPLETAERPNTLVDRAQRSP